MTAQPRLTDADYAALADFRHQLRLFLHFSSEAAESAGLSPTQHQALLAIKAAPTDQPITMGDLASWLQVRHHSAVGLVDRLAKRKLAKREHDPRDRRRVRLTLTAGGEKLIAQLSSAHKEELQSIAPALARLLATLTR